MLPIISLEELDLYNSQINCHHERTKFNVYFSIQTKKIITSWTVLCLFLLKSSVVSSFHLQNRLLDCSQEHEIRCKIEKEHSVGIDYSIDIWSPLGTQAT